MQEGIASLCEQARATDRLRVTSQLRMALGDDNFVCTVGIVSTRADQHAMTKVQLAALLKLEPGTQEWHEKLDHIESAVQQHVYQEEGSWLPEVIRYAPIEARQRMSTEFREYFDRFDRA